MIIDGAVRVALICYGRTYHGLSYDECDAIVDRVSALWNEKFDASDAVEHFDLVWGASLKAKIVNPGDWNVPPSPLSAADNMFAAAQQERYAEMLAPERNAPVEYDMPDFVARKPKKRKRKAV